MLIELDNLLYSFGFSKIVIKVGVRLISMQDNLEAFKSHHEFVEAGLNRILAASANAGIIETPE